MSRSGRLRRVLSVMLGVPLMGTLWLSMPGAVLAAQWDGTDPGLNACGNGSHTMYTLGWRNSSNKHGYEGFATNIYAGTTLIGKVEIRHSAYCATVWSRVTNLTGSHVQAKEAIVLFSDANGSGRVEHWYPTTDTLEPNGGTGWSNQYRDRSSFAARGGIYYGGAWRYAETGRSIAWAQDDGAFADDPFGCDGSDGHKCYRWPLQAPGVSATFHYGIAPGVYTMPNGSGGTVDVSGDVNYEFTQFNAVPAPSPFFYFDTYAYAEVHIDAADTGGAPGLTWRYNDGNGLYYGATVQLNNGPGANWSSSSSNRQAICHEIDHVMGLHHVWWHNWGDIDNVGSKATCIGAGPNVLTAPSTDDVSALKWVYAGVQP